MVLTIPHSNAGEERVFSVIHKIKHDDRGKLQMQGTLSSLIYVKLNFPEKPCYKFHLSPQLLKSAKKLLIITKKYVDIHQKIRYIIGVKIN